MNSEPTLKFDVILSKDAAKYIEKLDMQRKRQVFQVFLGMETNPLSGDIETIKGTPGYFRRRIGRYRLKFKLVIGTRQTEEPEKTKEIREVHVLDFGPRGDFRYQGKEPRLSGLLFSFRRGKLRYRNIGYYL
jgi:mRNA-degrading endonuclease RelE of RelBE toxin-antitoxin system